MRRRFGPFSDARDTLVASSLKRASQTADEISKVIRLPVVKRPGLREMDLGEWEGRRLAEIDQNDHRRLQQWFRDPTKVRLRGGEHVMRVRRRVRDEMQAMLAGRTGHSRLIVVTHGGWISVFLTDVVRIPLGRMWAFVLENCSLTRVYWDGRKMRLRSFNERLFAPAPTRRGGS